jgi:hypothetical protein
MPGVEIKGCFIDINIVNIDLNAWSGNKGVKTAFLDIFFTIN